MTGLWNSKDIQNSRQNCSKNKLVRENAVTRARGSCSLQVRDCAIIIRRGGGGAEKLEGGHYIKLLPR